MTLNKRAAAVVVCLVTMCAGAAQAMERVPETFRIKGEALIRARSLYKAGDPEVVAVVEKLKANAEKAMNGGPFSVTFKKGSLEGLGADVDAHTYVSIAPYYWPNPEKPNGLPYIGKDGERNPEFSQYDAGPLMELTDHVDTLALAGYLTGEQKYYDRAAVLIRTWFLDEKTRMKPSMDHCQLIKGENTGNHGGVIESRRVVEMIDAIEMMRADGSTAWTADDDKGMHGWVTEFSKWLQTSPLPVEEGWQKNNHGTWHDVQLITYLIWLGHMDEAKAKLEEAKNKRIWVQIDPDGKQPFELVRTRGFWYEEFNLNGLAQLAELGERAGVDLWNHKSVSQQSIRVAVDWLMPYATGEKKWTYQQIGGLSAKEMIVVLRLGEVAWKTNAYEGAIGKLVGQDVPTDNDFEHPLLPREIYGILYPKPE